MYKNLLIATDGSDLGDKALDAALDLARHNGASLTIGDVNDNRFNVHLIPETLRATTFADMTVGDRVNIEIDSQTQTIVDTLARMGYDRPPS